MKRLLQLATLLLMLAAILAPLAECFDRWDPPGLGHDTEMGTFAFVLLICLVLAVCRLLAVLALSHRLTPLSRLLSTTWLRSYQAPSAQPIFAPPGSPPPLRI